MTEQRNNEASFEDRENQLEIYEQIFENNWDAIVFANLEGKIQYANAAAYQLYGYDREQSELHGHNVDIFNAQKSHDTGEIIDTIVSQGGWSGQIVQRRKNNTSFTALLTVSLVYGRDGNPIGYASNSKDLTESMQNERQFSLALKEKEVLLAEVHHRVKNNLQLVSSILNLQSSFISDESVNATLTSIQHRIRAMSLIHEKLYRQDVSSIELNDYCEGLFRNIIHATAVHTMVECKVDVPEIELNIEKILPLGLLLNELITNSLKHAFLDRTEGYININAEITEGALHLKYSDDGVGFAGSASKGESSFGTLLINTFAEQLEGELQQTSDADGVRYSLQFQL